jgi:hypothetical protein
MLSIPLVNSAVSHDEDARMNTAIAGAHMATFGCNLLQALATA